MKLVLANNQSERFVGFHKGIQSKKELYIYAGLRSLLFDLGNGDPGTKLKFIDTKTGFRNSDAEGVYINGYLSTPELAAAVAIVLDRDGTPYVNREAGNAMSLTKLTAYAKLAAAEVPIPYTYGGAASAIAAGLEHVMLEYPMILKRADADRGVDNYKVQSADEVRARLKDQPRDSLWVLQEYIENDGFYLVSFYHDKAEFGIFRAMGERKKPDPSREHMFKPVGGRNASLLKAKDIPKPVLKASQDAIKATGRQIASVDSLFDSETNEVRILEVNYNPQLVTIETFKDVRIDAFLKAMKADWKKIPGTQKGTGKIVLGDSEYISLPGITASEIPARIDTGAATCAIWVSRLKKKNGVLEVVFWGPESEEFTGKVHAFEVFERVSVTSSNGGTERRYKIELPVIIGGKRFDTQFTLADRSTQTFPVLIGRNLLQDNFIVDVSKGIDV